MLLARDPELESHPTFLFFKGQPTGSSPKAPSSCADGVDDLKALMIGIRRERGSHRFFKRYGERFEDSEGSDLPEFADEEREHLDLLMREYRALITRRHAVKRARRPARPTAVAKPRRKARPTT